MTAAFQHLQELRQEADGTVGHEDYEIFEQLEEPLVAHHPHVHLYQALQEVDLLRGGQDIPAPSCPPPLPQLVFELRQSSVDEQLVTLLKNYFHQAGEVAWLP